MAPSAPSDAGSRVFGFAVMGVGAFTLTGSSSAPSPLYPVYQEMWGFSAAVLTVVFAIYVVSLLATLLTVGSLSDRIGRRPLVGAAMLILAISMVVFILADSAGWLIVARIIQGLAVGTATGAVAAGMIDLQPNPRIGPLINSIAPSLGLGLGAAGAGLLVQFAPFPTVLSYALVAALAIAIVIALPFVPEHSQPEGFSSRREALRALKPSVALPQGVRAQFFLVLPCLMSAWALGGLYMSLGTSIVDAVFGIDDRLVAGLAVATLFTAGSVAAVVMRRFAELRVVVTGVVLLTAGVVVVAAALLSGMVVLYFVGTAVAGFGWGSTFLGAMGIVSGLGRPNQRAQIFATMFVVCYLAFSVPAIAAGVATGTFGLTATAVGYSAIVATLALASGIALVLRQPKRAPVRLEEVTPA
ncbi:MULTISPECIES: MFS transporter [unclassified Rhodococcus (in: high G+C Gram-positive bacteria)]|uniref:MFS transporter n=1 Tax=Rhodococcus sp. SJ-3 TaxID=3454628 RepID=UPI002DAA47EC|nr:MFS transporter [Rhodococcus sp. (in: high G+C Gram-positive bacteria)]